MNGDTKSDGPDVDSRSVQANERTLLAWIRTGIALITFGFVIARVGLWLRLVAPPGAAAVSQHLGTAWIGEAFVGLGAMANAGAVLRFIMIRRALLAGKPIPVGAFPVVFAAIVTVLGSVLGTYVLLRML